MKSARFSISAVAAALGAAVMFTVGAAHAASADQRAESFITSRANDVLSVLNDDSMSLSEKKRVFRDLIEEVADVPKITRFVLGRYARNIEPAVMDEFSETFTRYAIGVYEERLSDYAGETLAVTGSTSVREGDYVVHSTITGGAQSDPLPVNWRVLIDEDGAKVVDVEIYGVWLAVNQREEIVSIIQNNRGEVSAATQALRQKTQELDVELISTGR